MGWLNSLRVIGCSMVLATVLGVSAERLGAVSIHCCAGWRRSTWG